MDRGLWIDIAKSQDSIVFVDYICGDFPAYDLAEYSFRGHVLFTPYFPAAGPRQFV